MKTIPVTIEFSEADAIALFRGNGVEVKETDVPGLFGAIDRVYKVVNPQNGYTYPLDKAFRAVINTRMQHRMLNFTDKLSIYHCLDKLK